MNRIAALACLVAIGCGGSSHPEGADGGSDGGALRDGGRVGDGGSDPADAMPPETCGDALAPGPSLGVPELPYFGSATATIVAVDASGVDLDSGGTHYRFAWPGDWDDSGLDRLAASMEVELTQMPGESRLVAPDVTLHAFAGRGQVPLDPFLAPIVLDGAPPIELASQCDGVFEGGMCGPVPVSVYDLTVGTSERLARGEHTSGDGYGIYFGGSTRYFGRTDSGCVDEAWFAASIAVRVDREPVTCASLEDDYARTIEQGSTCSASSDCHVISGHCGVGLGGCWYAVSADIEDELAGLANQYSDLGCTSAVCRCTAAPETVLCDSGHCELPP